MNRTTQAEEKPVIHYWHIKSRALYMNFMLAATGNLDKAVLSNTDSEGKPIPFPGTPEWKALAPEIKSPWNTIPTLVDKSSGTFIGESGALHTRARPYLPSRH